MDDITHTINHLKAGASPGVCGGYFAQLDPLFQLNILHSLCFERLARKHEDIRKIYIRSYENWNQTLYVLLLRFMGAPNNSRAFELLSQRLNYSIVLRYKDSLQMLEALFIGTSGLLDCYENDEYVMTLKRDFSYLSRKHNIEKLSPSEWVTTRIYPHNHPVLRLAQVAAFISQRDFVLDKVLECRTPNDVSRLFGINASDYWTYHFLPAHDSSAQIKRIGHHRSNVLGINVVVQLQFAYGYYMQYDHLQERALALLEAIPAETNSKVSCWTIHGVRPQNAFDTQALIQLGDCYCKSKRCEECPIGRRIIKSVKSRL